MGRLFSYGRQIMIKPTPPKSYYVLRGLVAPWRFYYPKWSRTGYRKDSDSIVSLDGNYRFRVDFEKDAVVDTIILTILSMSLIAGIYAVLLLP